MNEKTLLTWLDAGAPGEVGIGLVFFGSTTYTFLIDHPPTTISTTGHHDDNKREEKRRNFEAMRKAEATRNPRFL